MADLSARLDGLSPAKRKLLLERLRQGAARREAEKGAGEIPRIPREPGADLPLSFGQQQLWRIEQLAPGSPVYNVPLAASLEGDLDPAALAGALAGILDRHEVLRTRFEAVGTDARPVLEAAASLPLPQADLSGLPEALRRREAARLGAEETLRPFDLGRAPLLRALLLRLATRSWTLHLTLHHIASDGWSVGVLLGDLAAFYAGRAAGLPPLPVQYADFAAYQRRRLSGDRLEGLVAWWRERLTPPPPPLSLPLDRSRPPVPSAAGGQRVRVLPRELTGGLARLTGSLDDSQGATLFVTLLAGLQAVLRRYTGQEDVALGTPVAGRDRPELEGLIGYFVNTLVLRTSLAGDPTFRELLERCRETALGAWAHAELPFELLVERLRPERDPSLTPYFQVLLTLQNAPVPRLDLPGLTLAPLPPESEDGAAAKFDLDLTLSEENGALMAVASYRRDLFEGTTIQRFLSGFEILLTSAAAHPDRPLSRLPVMSDGECHQLLREWNDSAAPVPERSIYDLFEQHAAASPEDVAVEAGPEILTYRELARRCRHLAARLRAHGVGPEVPVGLLMETSPEAVVAVLGVLAAGGAFVPLDPLQPAERIAALLEETGAPVVLAVDELLARVPEGSWRVLPLEDKDSKDFKDDEDEVRLVDPLQAAYILYTSGSTGKPKGTVVSHRSLTNYLAWARQALPGPIALLSRLIFDACLKQLLTPFVSGDRVWVPVAKPVTAPREVMAELSTRPGATINCAPSIWRALLESVEAGGPGRIAYLLLGGEIVDPALLARTRKAIPGIDIRNVYGPTETTVNSTEGTIWDDEPSIGRPVANNQVHLLGPYLEALPPGAVGELYIGGAGLARGYLGRPDLTAERFLPDLFSEIPGERLYRTGDRVRQKPDGNLIVLGRFDDQIKIRGVRIEPGEVEAALARHPAVLRAAVLGIEDTPGASRLVAFAVLAADAAESPEDLRAFLEARLPAALVPSSFQLLEAFPLTATGKTDRRALARLASDRPATASYRPPVTPTEARLAEIWREILGAERVGVDDSFFELGGDSILALRLALRARESGLPLDAARLFLHPTVARLAADLDGAGAGAAPAVPAPQVGVTAGVGRRDLDRLRRKLGP